MSTKPQPRNPISVRLYKVLSTTYDDKETREALNTLSGFVEKTADGSYDPTLAAKARKNLRRDVELRVSQDSRAFLKAFKDVDSTLDTLQKCVENMRTQCSGAEEQVKATSQACSTLLSRAEGYQTMRTSTTAKSTLANAFIQHFVLPEEDINRLRSRTTPLDKSFFASMERVEKIRLDCQLLMAGEEGPTKAGTDLMTSTAQNLDEGYDKISRWCLIEFRQVGKDSHLEVGPVMREAILWLKKRPEMIHDVLVVLCQTRQSTLLNQFMDALSLGGPNGFPRPIDIHAHDPIRYVGDMLAWVHQTIAGEREFLESLFSLQGDGRMVGSVRKFDGNEDENRMQYIMDQAFEKLCTPLKIRIAQTVRSQESPIISYKLANVLQFYSLTLSRTVGPETVLAKTLGDITRNAFNTFYDTLRSKTRALLNTSLPDDQDVHPPLVVLDHTQVLREIMSVYNSALLGDETEEERRTGFQLVLDIMVDAVVDMCLKTSEVRKRQRPTWDKDIFMLNCLTYLQEVIKPFTFANTKFDAIQQDVCKRVEDLTAEHYQRLLLDTHLSQCMDICEKGSNEPMSRIGAMQTGALEGTLRYFSVWLSSPEILHPPTRLSHLLDQRLKGKIYQAALFRLAKAYETICAEVRKPENRYEAGNTMLGSQRPFGQMPTLMQILGLDYLEHTVESTQVDHA